MMVGRELSATTSACGRIRRVGERSASDREVVLAVAG